MHLQVVLRPIVSRTQTCTFMRVLSIVQKFNLGFKVWYFNATFNNISVISWRSVLLVEETGVHGENHRAVASH